MAIEDQPGDLVVLIRDHRLVEELLERHVRERHPRRDHLFRAFGRHSGKTVAGPRRRRLGEQFAQVAEYVGGGADDLAMDHADFPRARDPLRCLGYPIITWATAWKRFFQMRPAAPANRRLVQRSVAATEKA